MSGMRHPTISAWQRQEGGGYTAELHGWTLRVRWHPESAGGGRGFTWEAEQTGSKLSSEETFEEIEVAMAHAEARVAPARTGRGAGTTGLGEVHH